MASVTGRSVSYNILNVPSYCLIFPHFTPALRILKPRMTYTLGRDADTDFQLPAELVSRRHAEIQWTLTNGFVIRDRKSTNGTRVNGVPVLQPQLLKDGDTIEIGPFVLRFRELGGDISELDRLSKQASETVDAELIALSDAAAAAPTSPSVAFGGVWDGQELLAMVDLISTRELTGVLTVRGENVEGQVGFEKGEIRRARSGDKAGEEAVRAVLRQARGRYDFASGPLRLEPNCRLKAKPILVDVARQLDESTPKPAPTLAPDGFLLSADGFPVPSAGSDSTTRHAMPVPDETPPKAGASTAATGDESGLCDSNPANP